MVLATYLDLRRHFCLGAPTSGVSLTFDAATSTIARPSGSFVTDGYEVGMTLDVFGTTSNDGRYTLSAVSALTLTVEEALANETIAAGLWGSFYETDAMEQWPRSKMHTAGFDAEPTMSAQPFTPLPITISCNGGVTDAVAGDTYKWHLRQRTDVAANQYMTCSHADSTKTGTVTLALTSLAVTELGLGATTDPLNAGQRAQLLKHCRLFVQRASDRAIQMYDLGRLSEGHTI